MDPDPKGEALDANTIAQIESPHYGHRVGVVRRTDDLTRVVAIQCLTCGKDGKDLQIWPPTN